VSSREDVPVFTPPNGFQPPIWLGRGERKHIPEPNWSLASVIEQSKGREGDAYYDPRLSLAKIERI
jgi:hypothetical protein